MLAYFGNQSNRIGPMHRILIVAVFVIAGWLAVPGSANAEDCAWPMDNQAMQAIAKRPADWNALRDFHNEFHACDSDVIALSISESVIGLLSHDGGDLELLNDVVLADDAFRAFILRHVDEMALPSELRRVIANLRQCPGSARRLCLDIRERAETALVTPPWGDGPHTCTRNLEFRALSVAGSSANWATHYEIYQIYHVCDDGAIAEGFSWSVVKLLGKGGGGLAELNTLVAGDDEFRDFIFKHISGYSTRGELEPVIANARNCPSGLESFCEEIRIAAEAAIVENESY